MRGCFGPTKVQSPVAREARRRRIQAGQPARRGTPVKRSNPELGSPWRIGRSVRHAAVIGSDVVTIDGNTRQDGLGSAGSQIRQPQLWLGVGSSSTPQKMVQLLAAGRENVARLRSSRQQESISFGLDLPCSLDIVDPELAVSDAD